MGLVSPCPRAFLLIKWFRTFLQWRFGASVAQLTSRTCSKCVNNMGRSAWLFTHTIYQQVERALTGWCVFMRMLTVSEVRSASDGRWEVQANAVSGERVWDTSRAAPAEVSRAQVVVGHQLCECLCYSCVYYSLRRINLLINSVTLCTDSLYCAMQCFW